jgi:hypothetical protein
MEIIEFRDVKKGDVLLIDGLNGPCVVTVSEKTNDGLIIPKEIGGLDYAPENPNLIVRLGSKKEPLKKIDVFVESIDVGCWNARNPKF